MLALSSLYLLTGAALAHALGPQRPVVFPAHLASGYGVTEAPLSVRTIFVMW